MRDIIIVAGAFVVVLILALWLDQRQAHKRWLQRDAWRGSNLRDPKANKAFPPKRYEYRGKDNER